MVINGDILEDQRGASRCDPQEGAGDNLRSTVTDEAAKQACNDRAQQRQENCGNELHRLLPLQLADFLDRDGAAVAEEDDDDSQTNRRFSSGHSQDEHGKDLPNQII